MDGSEDSEIALMKPGHVLVKVFLRVKIESEWETSESLVAKINAFADQYGLKILSLEGQDMHSKDFNSPLYCTHPHCRLAALAGYRVCYQKPHY